MHVDSGAIHRILDRMTPTIFVLVATILLTILLAGCSNDAVEYLVMTSSPSPDSNRLMTSTPMKSPVPKSTATSIPTITVEPIKHERLLFSLHHEEGSDLFLSFLNESSLVQLTQFPGFIDPLDFSSNGAEVLAFSYDSVLRPEVAVLHQIAVDGSSHHVLSESFYVKNMFPHARARWLDNETGIIAIEEDAESKRHLVIITISDSGVDRSVISAPNPLEIYFLADGWVYWEESYDEGGRIFSSTHRTRLDGSVTEDVWDFRPDALSFSPVAQTLAYAIRNLNDSFSVYVSSAEGSNPIEIFSVELSDCTSDVTLTLPREPIWSPSGQRLLIRAQNFETGLVPACEDWYIWSAADNSVSKTSFPFHTSYLPDWSSDEESIVSRPSPKIGGFPFIYEINTGEIIEVLTELPGNPWVAWIKWVP